MTKAGSNRVAGLLAAFGGLLATIAGGCGGPSDVSPAPRRNESRRAEASQSSKGQPDPAPETNVNAAAPPGDAPEGMVWIPGGVFLMGSDAPSAEPQERPAHRVRIDGFWLDATEVTNRQFAEFVKATGYVTTAEKAPVLEEIMKQLPKGAPPPPKELLVPGSAVFVTTDEPASPGDAPPWWKWTPGACWKHPEGPDSDLDGRDDEPVVQVSWDDAVAFAGWAGKRLPTEAEWERAARGGRDGEPFVWGQSPPDEEHPQANIWQGEFPLHNTAADGFARASPVREFPPNRYGLYDMAGNVWEWCQDWYRFDAYGDSPGGVTLNPQGPRSSLDPREPDVPKRVVRGGSFLCHASYCASYRPSARRGTAVDTSLSHTGFRCARSAPKE